MLQKMLQITFWSIPVAKNILRSAKKWYFPYSAFSSRGQWGGRGAIASSRLRGYATACNQDRRKNDSFTLSVSLPTATPFKSNQLVIIVKSGVSNIHCIKFLALKEATSFISLIYFTWGITNVFYTEGWHKCQPFLHYLTTKNMGTSNLACGLVFTNLFLENPTLSSSLRRHGHFFWKWCTHFLRRGSQEVQILYMGFIFWYQILKAQVKLVTSQKYLMTSFKVNFGQKNVQTSESGIWENSKLGNFPLLVLLATWYFQELFVNKFDSKSSWFEEKIWISEEIYQKKKKTKREGDKNAPPSCKVRLNNHDQIHTCNYNMTNNERLCKLCFPNIHPAKLQQKRGRLG